MAVDVRLEKSCPVPARIADGPVKVTPRAEGGGSGFQRTQVLNLFFIRNLYCGAERHKFNLRPHPRLFSSSVHGYMGARSRPILRAPLNMLKRHSVIIISKSIDDNKAAAYSIA